MNHRRLAEPSPRNTRLFAESQLDHWLARMSAPQTRVVADLGAQFVGQHRRLASQFNELVLLDSSAQRIAALRRDVDPKQVTCRRRDLRDLTPFHGKLDAVLSCGPLEARSLADLDRSWHEAGRCLREGGLLLGTYPASPRETIARAYLLDDGKTPVPPTMHEVELQYRLQRAGLRAATIRRAPDRMGETEQLVFRAVRRADN